MAGITSGASLPEPEDFDYSVSHRAVPVPSVQYASTPERRPPEFGEEPGQPREGRHNAGGGSRRRRGSLDRLLHRSASQSTTAGDAPPLPSNLNTRIARAHAHAASNDPEHYLDTSGENHARYNSTNGSRKGEGASTMLRKLSSGRHEQDRQAREAAIAQAAQQRQTPRQPPRLPSINDFQDGARPDSLAIFNNQYGSHAPSPPPATTANFSRPGNAANMAPSSSYNSSSSPAYAIRPGNAFAQQAAASSSPATRSTDSESAGASQSLDRQESMAHRGRYSYASSNAQPVAHVNSPRRVRRRKDPTPFNILVVGAKNSGKTSFITFLRHSFALPANKQPYTTDAAGDAAQSKGSNASFTSHYLETEMEGERVGLTLWDSAGLEKHIIDLQLREMAAFVESKFEETFVEEQKVNRSPGVKDTHIHCVLLVLDPIRLDGTAAAASGTAKKVNAEGLDDEMDLQVIRALWGKTTVIPVVSKADTLTVGHMAFLKRAVWGSLKTAKLDPLEALELDDDDVEEELDDDTLAEEDEDEAHDNVVSNLEGSSSDSSDSSPLPKPKRNPHNRQSSLAGTAATNPSSNGDDNPPYIPMSILSPDPLSLPPHATPAAHAPVGRRFPWGFADPYDAEHCDFVRLRDSIFSEWRGDLRDLARTKWYENWRTSRLKNLPGSGGRRVKGGITPVGAVPREGRTTSARDVREVSGGGAAAAGAAGVPRSVEGGAGVGGEQQPRSTSKAERMMGISAGEAQGIPSSSSAGSRGGQYRGVESYQ